MKKREDYEAVKEKTKYEPKQRNRFMVEFPKEFGIEPWYVNTASRPKYYESKWGDMEVTFIDMVGISSSKGLFKLIQTVSELKKVIPTGLPLFTYKLISLDPTGVVIETWEIGVSEILSVNFGEDLDYGSEELQRPKLVMRPMYCNYLIPE